VFLRDRVLHTTRRVNVTSAGAEATYPPFCGGPPFGAIYGADVSGDGRYVVFASKADNLFPNDLNQDFDVFVHDALTGATDVLCPWATMYTTGQNPVMSDDGRFIAFETLSHLVVPGTPPPLGGMQIVWCDRNLGVCQWASFSPSGQPANVYETGRPRISGDGRYVMFESDANNLVTPDTNDAWDAFLWDSQSGTTERLSNSVSGGLLRANSAPGGISTDGSYITVDTAALTMMAGGLGGVALIDRTLTAPPITNYCIGKTNSLGCVPSIAPTGLPSIAGKYAFFATALQVLNHRNGTFVWGTAPAQSPFMGGTLCVQAPIRMTAVQDSSGNAGVGTDCSGWHSFLMTPPWMQARGWTAGTTIYCQFFCRDPALAPPDQIAFSNAMNFTVVP
jgi:hypothetical protein